MSALKHYAAAWLRVRTVISMSSGSTGTLRGYCHYLSLELPAARIRIYVNISTEARISKPRQPVNLVVEDAVSS